jgi:hypothetical protein
MTRTRPSRNNQRKTITTNPKQYLQLQNFEKYDHVYDAQLNFVIVINRKSNDPKGIFDFDRLTSQINADCINRVKLIRNAFLYSQRNDL